MRVQIVDAFTDRAFAGNPAAVCRVDGDWPDAAWMQRVAAELNLPMTAFVQPPRNGVLGLRWFTTLSEQRICGHATLATAFVLGGAQPLRFDTLGGELAARVADDGLVTLDFPAAVPVARDPVDGLAGALGAAPVEVHGTGELGDVLAVFEDEAAVRALAPAMDALAEVTRREDIRGVVATSPGTDGDFVSRFFSPADGIPEDPVTGSAHTALAPFWAQRLGSTRLVGRQLSARGGTIQTALAGERVLLSGRAVLVLDGELQA
jgi:predicted PhzF superfamily epimerase YddE/YHI9